MSEIALGVTLPQFSGDRERLLRSTRAAERAGLDSVWVFDHLWPMSGGKERPVLECWMTIAWLAAATERITLGTFVTRSSLREPALLAKMAATVASVAPGRLIVGIGSGDELSRTENEAFGLPYYEADERVGQLRGTVRAVRDHLRGETLSVDEGPVRIHELPASPHPHPVPPVWLGGRADDVLEVAGAHADGWNAWAGTPKRFAADAQQVLAYAGERPIELSWGGICVLAATDEAAHAALGERAPEDRVVGGPATVAARLGEFVAAGARHLILTPLGSAGDDAFYELVADVRSRL